MTRTRAHGGDVTRLLSRGTRILNDGKADSGNHRRGENLIFLNVGHTVFNSLHTSEKDGSIGMGGLEAVFQVVGGGIHILTEADVTYKERQGKRVS